MSEHKWLTEVDIERIEATTARLEERLLTASLFVPDMHRLIADRREMRQRIRWMTEDADAYFKEQGFSTCPWYSYEKAVEVITDD